MLGSSIIVGLISVFNSLISFANQLVIAKLFGATVLMDAYLIAVSVPLLIAGAISGVMSYSLVPFFIILKENDDIYVRITTLTLMIFTFLSLITVAIGFATANIFISTFGKALPPAVKASAESIFRISCVSSGFAVLAGHFTAMHNVRKRFLLPVMSNIFPFLMMICFGLTMGKTFGPISIAWGMLVGYIIMVIVLTKTAMMDVKISKKCFLVWKQVIEYFSHTPLVLLSMLCFTVYQSIDAYWAPKIGASNLSYLGYCQRLLIAIGNIVIAGPSVVMVPRLAESFHEGRRADFFHDTGRAVRMVIAFAAPLAIIVSMLSEPIVRILFQRGAFDAHATCSVAELMPFMMIGMVAMLCVAMIFRAFFARHEILFPSILGAASILIYFTLSGLCSSLWGVTGIAFAYAVSWWVLFSVAVYSLWRENPNNLFSKSNLIFIYHIILTATVVSLVVFLGKIFYFNAFDHGGLFTRLFGLILVACIAIVSFYVVAVRVFKISDIAFVFEFIFFKVCTFYK